MGLIWCFPLFFFAFASCVVFCRRCLQLPSFFFVKSRPFVAFPLCSGFPWHLCETFSFLLLTQVLCFLPFFPPFSFRPGAELVVLISLEELFFVPIRREFALLFFFRPDHFSFLVFTCPFPLIGPIDTPMRLKIGVFRPPRIRVRYGRFVHLGPLVDFVCKCAPS